MLDVGIDVGREAGRGERTDRHALRKPLRLKTYIMIAVMILAGPLGNVLLGRGMKHLGGAALWPVAALLHTLPRILASGSIWLGIASLVTFFVAYMLVLSWADYSFVQPTSSLAYGVVALLSWWMLGERVSPVRWLGIAVICLGVFVVGRTSEQTAHEQQGPRPAELQATEQV